jgi:Lens epithelium-derived growth factor (LEDGF)
MSRATVQSRFLPFSELHSLTVGALVVKKHPQVVDTVRKLRKYVGPKNRGADELEMLKDEIGKIRLKASSIYVKIKSSFAMPGQFIFVCSYFIANLVNNWRSLPFYIFLTKNQ